MLVPLRPLMEAAEKVQLRPGRFQRQRRGPGQGRHRKHETFRSPAILQGADLANAFMGGRVDFANGTLEDKKVGARRIADAVRKYGENSPIPVVLHLDHGRDFDSCVAAIDGGYTSRHDRRLLPAPGAEHRADTAKSSSTHTRSASVSKVSWACSAARRTTSLPRPPLTPTPLDAVKFIEETGVDALAISYGTQHGANKGKNAKLRREIAIAIKECINRSASSAPLSATAAPPCLST